MPKILTMDDFDFKGKTALVRVDFNSPVDPDSKKVLDDTRIKAQTRPNKVDKNKEPMVRTMVSQTPCIRMGRNSCASFKNFCMGGYRSPSYEKHGF